MAHYLVTARPQAEGLDELERKLAAGAFEGLRPFGAELSSALKNARVRSDDRAVWEEEDYCSPPLAQEREAVLDDYFDDISVEPVEPGAGWSAIGELPRLFPELESAAGPSGD